MLAVRIPIVALLLAAFIGVGLVAQAQTAAGPRTGTVYVLEVDLANAAAIRELGEAGYNIGHVNGMTVEIFATPAERDAIEAMGLNPRLVETQPNPPAPSPTRALGVYHSYNALTLHLQDVIAMYPSLTNLVSVGQSVQGREMWALHISDDPMIEEDEPEFVYISTMHGDERVGTEMCLYFIDHLLANYGTDTRITDLVDETAIWIMPLMNPDGLELGSRFNANGFDLNRSFPQFGVDFFGDRFLGSTDTSGWQPEVARIIEWTESESFTLVANLHTGALVVSYPLDGEVSVPSGVDLPSVDDLLFEDFALRYSLNNPPMAASPFFAQGITNGNEWFKVLGSMQDYQYRFGLAPGMLMELSLPKIPPSSALPGLWDDNRESMLQYAEASHTGVRGIVTDAISGDPIRAYVVVESFEKSTVSDPDVGDYHRVLLPGTYDLSFLALGYQSVTVKDVVVGSGAATRVDVQMSVAVIPAANRIPLALLMLALGGVAAALLLRFTHKETGGAA